MHVCVTKHGFGFRHCAGVPEWLRLHRKTSHNFPAAAAQESSSPFHIGFQINERNLLWDESAQRRLVKIGVAQKLDVTVEVVEERLLQLSAVLPDLMVNKLESMKVDLLAALCRDPGHTAQRLVELRTLLPTIDVAQLVASAPWLMTLQSMENLAQQVQKLRQVMQGLYFGGQCNYCSTALATFLRSHSSPRRHSPSTPPPCL